MTLPGSESSVDVEASDPDVQASPDADFDYEQLGEATVATGKFNPPSKSSWFLTGQADEVSSLNYVAINPTPFRIGRRSDLSLCLPFKTVSSLHAELFEDGDAVLVRDMGSTNGTYVNGARIKDAVELKKDDLLQFANIAFRVVHEATQTYGQTAIVDVCDQALALTRFDELINDRAVVPHFQPIVDMSDGRDRGYEILGRSRLFGLNSPKQMFLAAAQLNLETELSRLLRHEGIQSGMTLPNRPHLFVNTHPLELSEPNSLYKSLEEIRALNPDQDITLEIHESAVLDPQTMKDLRSVLHSLNVSLAYDDFGAGQARLVELIKVSPDYLKFDMTLVQEIHKASAKHQQMLASLVEMSHGLNIASLAEGVECKEDHETCRQMGFELGQGYYYGKPAPAKNFI